MQYLYFTLSVIIPGFISLFIEENITEIRSSWLIKIFKSLIYSNFNFVLILLVTYLRGWGESPVNGFFIDPTIQVLFKFMVLSITFTLLLPHIFILIKTSYNLLVKKSHEK